MLYNLLFPFAEQFGLFNLFQYLTFRTAGAVVTSLIICFYLGPKLISWLKMKQGEGQPIRDDGPESHLKKKGTPTMGGLMILISLTISTLLWVDMTNAHYWIVLLVTVGYGTIGFMDDYLKLTKRNTAGLPGKLKLVSQFAISGIAAAWLYFITPESATGLVDAAKEVVDPDKTALRDGLALPFVKDYLLPLGFLMIPFGMLVMIGASNAVNLTDGLDGLATVPVIMAAGCFGLIAWLTGNIVFAEYLNLFYVEGVGELAVFCGALIGACMGFLWFNAPPAMVFMGDTGSLALGGALGSIAVVTKNEFTLAIIGGLFVLETVSVIIQVASYRLTGKRVFRMAPIHHHFEKKGWPETTVVIRFWIIAAILALIGLASLKIR